jgi:hypothetical protein
MADPDLERGNFMSLPGLPIHANLFGAGSCPGPLFIRGDAGAHNDFVRILSQPELSAYSLSLYICSYS